MDAEYFVERENPSAGDGFLVKQRGMGTVCYCFDDSGDEARKIAKFLNNQVAVSELVDACVERNEAEGKYYSAESLYGENSNSEDMCTARLRMQKATKRYTAALSTIRSTL